MNSIAPAWQQPVQRPIDSLVAPHLVPAHPARSTPRPWHIPMCQPCRRRCRQVSTSAQYQHSTCREAFTSVHCSRRSRPSMPPVPRASSSASEARRPAGATDACASLADGLRHGIDMQGLVGIADGGCAAVWDMAVHVGAPPRKFSVCNYNDTIMILQ